MWGFMERHHILKKMTNFLMEFDISENCFELGKAGASRIFNKVWSHTFFGDLSGQAKKNADFSFMQDFAWPLRPQNLINPKILWNVHVAPAFTIPKQFFSIRKLVIYCNTYVFPPISPHKKIKKNVLNLVLSTS